MSNVDKFKKKAAEFEQKKQFDRALEVYLQIIGQTEGQEDRDVTVYNRVGDLYLRLNKADQAVNYYEQAVDLYTDGGYLNNAIALCKAVTAALMSAPRSNRADASVFRPSRLLVRRTDTGWKQALSNTTVRVDEETSDAAPPMTPAIAWARSRSAMTSMSGSSFRSTPARRGQASRRCARSTAAPAGPPSG